MDRASRPVSFQDVQKLARRCQFYLLRWETEFTPCTGITAVTRQERRYFRRRGVMIAPWESRMPAAKAALDQGRVVDLESPFRIAGPCARWRVGASADDTARRGDADYLPGRRGGVSRLAHSLRYTRAGATPWSSERRLRSSFPRSGPRAASSCGEPTGRRFPP